ncbi:MAG: putative molybdenum carrier protein [Alphaproteobacteria bacterium]
MDHSLTIISGGQTGVDRAALDAALAAGLSCGGWCPLGREAEDGPIAPRYTLREAASPDPARRTLLNVRDSDATLIIAHGPLSGGTELTARHAKLLSRPYLVIDLAGTEDEIAHAARIKDWLGEQGVRKLNVAGPRESGVPGIYDAAQALLGPLFLALAAQPPAADTVGRKPIEF